MSETGCSKSLLLLTLLLAYLGQVPGEGGAFQRVFQTEETVRQNKAHEMRRQMNFRASPCSDFYEYACGNWETESTPLAKLEHRIDVDLMRLLEESAHRKDSALARQAKEFYQSCLVARAHQSQQQQDFLSDFIQQNGGFPAVPGSKWAAYNLEYNWAQVTGRLRRHYGMDILIGLRVSYNYASVQENSIYLSEPTTLIPRELCTKRHLNERDSAYKAIERLVATQLKTWLAMGNEESARLAGEIVSLEHELCGGMHGLEPWNAEQQLYTANFTRKTLSELSQLYDLDFKTYVSSIYDQTIFRPVYMAAPDYYRQLKRTLSIRNGTQIANYVMYRAVAALIFPLEDKPEHRPAYCLATVKRLLPAALGELYASQYVTEEFRLQLLQLYDQLKDALKRSVSADWLEEGSRRVAQRKLSDLQLILPSYEQPLALRLTLDRSNYWHNLRQLLDEVQAQQLKRQLEESPPMPADPVEAYETRVHYRPVQRRLEMGWALLQPPDYDERYGHALRYATVGTVLARQMATAFDELHWSIGLLEHDNWDPLTAYRYQNRSECFGRHVEEYLQHNSTATQLLINSSAGLNIAFNAYLTWLGLQAPNNDFVRLTKETLPGLNYSNTALFFLAFAQQHCNPKEQHYGEPNLWPTITYSVRQSHSWTRLAVNGPLRNLADFAREFHCPAGSPMNPSEKCTIY